MKSLLMLILIFFYNCSNSNFGSKDDLLRGFALTYPDPAPKQNLKLSIQGQLKDGKGNPMAYKLMSTSQGLDSSAQVRQSTNTVKVRFVDYSLKPNKLKGMFIIQNESDESKIAKYDLYWGDGSTKAKIASFTKTGKKLQFVIDEVERPSFAKKFFLFSADTGQVNTVELENTKVQDTSAGTITDKDGNFELKLDAGVKTDVNIQDPVKDVASFSADLTKINSLEKMNDLQKSIAEKGFTEGFLNAYTQSSGGISLTGSVIAISEPVSTSNTTITTASTTPSEPVINFNEVVSTTTTAVAVTTTTTTTVTPVTPPPTYTIEVNVTGLTGTGLVLQNNASNNLSISGNGSIPFSGSFPQGSTYDVKVLTQPTGQTCAITGGSGTLLTSAAVMVNCSSSLKEITSFSLVNPALVGTISGTNISLTVPFGTSLTALVANFITSGASVKVGSTVQSSGITANDFSSPVIYTVTAADSSTQNYTVTVTVNANNPPTASSVAISGTLSLGSTLTGSFTYSDPDGHAAGTHIYQWYRCTDNSTVGSCSAISGATTTTYIVQAADDAKYIRFEVTPKDTYSFAGTAVKSNPTVLIDALVPTFPNGNYIKATSVTSNSVSLSWNLASDTVTSQANLQYKLYYSTSSAMGTIAEVEAGTLVGTYTNSPTFPVTVSALTPETMYYFNVIVADQAGNKSVYQKKVEYPSASIYFLYSFDGDANDKGPNGFNGTVNAGVSLTTDKDGNTNSAYSFNGGTSAFIQLPALNPTLSSGYTIFVRVYYAAWNNYSRILDFGNGSGVDNILLANQTTTSTLAYEYYGNTVSLQNNQITSFWVLNQWTTIAIVQNGTSINIYKNGVLSNQITASNGITTVNRTLCYIGKSNWAVDGYFSGKIDDIRFYTKPLTTTEIQGLQ